MRIIDVFFESPFIASVLGVMIVVGLVTYALVKRYRVAGPSEAFILTGRRGNETHVNAGQKVVVGAGVFVWPMIQKLHVVDLSARRINVSIASAVSAKGVRCSLEGVAIVKVGGTEEAIRAAAQRFLHQQHEIETFTTEVLAGALRAIVGRLTIEDIIRDRAAFASEVAEEAETSLVNQGLLLDTFQVQDIQTEGTYLADLGRPEQARVERDAAIAEAQTHQESEQARYLAEEEVLEAQRAFEVRQASIRAETDAAKAQADAAGPLAKAARDEEVITAQERVAIREAELTDRKLDTEVRKPADAARYRVETEAQAERQATILRAEAARESAIAEAQAQAERNRLDGSSERARREDLAHAVRTEGASEASAVEALGNAEATAMLKKADAFKQYNDAAVMQMLIEQLPEIVRGAAEPLSNVDKLTVISTDGASSMPKAVVNNVNQAMEMLDNLGLDLGGILKKFMSQGVTGENGDAGTSVEPHRPQE